MLVNEGVLRFYKFSWADTFDSYHRDQTPDAPSHSRWVPLVIQVYWISFSVGLHSFFWAFFKKHESVKFYGLIQKKIKTKHPGNRLWENNDIHIDCGETLADGSTNIVWQKQAQTKNPALKKIASTHAKLLTQQISPRSNPRKLEKDAHRKMR
jgi:hypothetical protein